MVHACCSVSDPLRPRKLAFVIVAASVAFAFGSVGCKRGGLGQPIVDVQIVDRAGIGVDRAQSIDRAKLRTHAVAAVERLGVYKVREAAEGELGWQLTVAVQLTAERHARPEDAGVIPKDRVYRAVGVTMRLHALGRDVPKGLRPRYESEALVARNSPLFESFDTLAGEAIREAVRFVEIELALSRADAEVVIAKLDDEDARVRASAVVEARHRKLAAAVPKLIEILQSDERDPDVVLETIGALIDSRDPRAVGPLIDSARRRSPVYLSQILFGVAAIGGKEAEAYLFTVSSGHPDSTVRKNAKDALQEMERATKDE